MNGPRPMPTPAVADQIPIALARSERGKTSMITDSVAGIIIAPPTPIAARSTISWPELWASAARTDARPNRISPDCSARLRPKRSPSVPIVSRTPANASRYASTIHCRVDAEASKCVCNVGSATLSTVLSSPMISRLRDSTNSVFQRRAWTAGSGCMVGLPQVRRRMSWAQRSGSSRNGAWPPSSTSRRASGNWCAAARPIDGPP